jgi:cytoskeleton protein RodZ
MARDTASTPGDLLDDAAASGGVDLTPANDQGPGGAPFLALQSGPHLGAGLRAAREHLGLTIDDVADATKVRPQYLRALEALDMDKLPSRPFAAGYVRAYARVLGVDEEQAIGRFRRDAPSGDQSLRAPVGVPKESDPRVGLIMTGFAIIVTAIVIWNIAQRTMAEREPDISGAVAEAPLTPPPEGPVSLGEALPAPPEATVPTPYVTPGLEQPDPNAPPPSASAQQPILIPAEPRPFRAKGPIYGAPAAASLVTIQVTRSVSVVVRGPDERVYFAQQMKEGEAYRTPSLPGLVIDVTAPEAVDVFIAGVHRGKLGRLVTPLAALEKEAPAPPQPAPVQNGLAQ